jgi:hypothetical protein
MAGRLENMMSTPMGAAGEDVPSMKLLSIVRS